MNPQPRTAAEERYWTTYGALLTHSAGCPRCKGAGKGAGAEPCLPGARLVRAHRAAKAAKRKERS